MYAGQETGFSTEVERVVQNAMKKNPYAIYGTSSYNDNRKLKAAGGRFNPDRKKWYAHNSQALQALIDTKKWTPIGVQRHEYKDLVQEVNCLLGSPWIHYS